MNQISLPWQAIALIIFYGINALFLAFSAPTVSELEPTLMDSVIFPPEVSEEEKKQYIEHSLAVLKYIFWAGIFINLGLIWSIWAKKRWGLWTITLFSGVGGVFSLFSGAFFGVLLSAGIVFLSVSCLQHQAFSTKKGVIFHLPKIFK